MTKQEIFNKKYRPELLNRFLTPRIVKDLEKFPPNTKEVERLSKHILENRSIFLFGEVKTGKTLLAAELLMKYYEKQYIDNKQSKVKFISFPSLLMELKSTFDNKEKKEDVILNGFCTYDLLVLDDFGIWRNSDWLYNTLYILINERYENFKPTIFTSNIDIKTITKNLKDLRIPRRIVDMCIEIIEV